MARTPTPHPTNHWDFLKVAAICICAYALGSKITATNWDITEVNTGAISTVIGTAGYAFVKKAGWM